MPPDLPQEIHNLIIDLVASGTHQKSDRQTLGACAAASHVLIHRAYHHLFSHIHLQLDLRSDKQWESRNALRNFISLLRSSLRSPDISIARYLRRFDLSIRTSRLGSPLIFINYSLSELFKALYSLTRVEYLKVSADIFSLSFDSRQDSQQDQLFPVSEALFDLCHSPTLSTLALLNFTDVPTSLLRDSRIKHIDMSRVSFSSYSCQQRKFIHQLESITVDGASFRFLVDALHGGGGPIDKSVRLQEAFGHLHTLEIRSGFVHDVPECLKMAAAAGNTLVTLHLHLLTSSYGPPLASNQTSGVPKYLFHLISGLRTLRISFSHTPESCLIKPLGNFLNTSTFPRSLQTLDIEAKSCLSVDTTYNIECDCRPTIETGHWGLLDAALTKPIFGAVPRLFVKYFIASTKGRELDEELLIAQTYKAVEDALPDFRNTRLLPLKGRLCVLPARC